jgi:hypothetical protein
LLAPLLLAALPDAATAGWLGFRNETSGPVVVQGASSVNNIVRRGKPYLLYPGEVAWDFISVPGAKLLTVYDAKQPTQVLYQDTVLVAGADLFFAIQPEPLTPTPAPVTPTTATPAPKGGKPSPAKVKLLPTRAPMPPPVLGVGPPRPPGPVPTPPGPQQPAPKR